MEDQVQDFVPEQDLASDKIADLVEYLALSLVDYPEELTIDVTDSADNACLIELSVAPDDVGKIIGRRGRIIKAIRTLAYALGAKSELNVEVEVLG